MKPILPVVDDSRDALANLEHVLQQRYGLLRMAWTRIASPC